MAVSPRVLLLLLSGGLVMAGLALGAESQVETFLKPEQLESGFADTPDAGGNLVVLTGLLVALGVTLGGVWLSRRPALHRVAPAVGLFLSTYLLVVLVQSSWPNYNASDAARTAVFSITPLVSNGEALASVFVGPLAFVLLGILGVGASGRALLADPVRDGRSGHRSGHRFDLGAALHRYVGLHLTAVPFLAVLAVGSVALMLHLPGNDPDAGPYYFVLPVVALASLGLLITGSLKAAHLHAYARDARLVDVAREAWSGLRRAEYVLGGVLAGSALLATLLEPIDLEALEAGRTFATTTRGHVQAALLLSVAVLPGLLMGRDRLFEDAAPDGPPEDLPRVRPGVAAWTWVGTGLSVLGALVGALIPGALWGWLLALLPVVVVALRLLPGRDAAPAGMLAAVVLWGMGNTVTGVFQLNESADASLQLDANSGLLALFRAAAVVLAAVVVSRIARDDAAGLRRSVAWPLTAGLGAATALAFVLELPFGAWIANTGQGAFVGIGSVLASQDPAVKATMHVLTAAASALVGLGVARIHRPDWFSRGRSPLPDLSESESGAEGAASPT